MENNPVSASLQILEHQFSQLIMANANNLEDCRTKFCSVNSLRFLHWAHETYETSPIVASFCALNATEEAVVAFISAAKKHGHKKYAKQINLHCHRSKALVSVFAQRCSKIAKQGKLSIALYPSRDTLAFRVPNGDEYHYGDLHLSKFRINSKAQAPGDIELGETPSLEDIQAEVERVAEARNKLLYATNTGIQTGFKDPQASLIRETKLSLGLIWAAVDIYINPDQDRPFIDNILEDMASIHTNGKARV